MDATKLAERQHLMDLPEGAVPCLECGSGPPHRILPDGAGGLALRCRQCGTDVEAAWDAKRRADRDAELSIRKATVAKLAELNAARTQALDFTTIAHCLQILETELPGPLDWRTPGLFFDWLTEHGDEIQQLSDLEGKASTDHEVLNQFLVEHGFKPMFQPLAAVGVVSILDMLVKWSMPASATDIRRDGKTYPAFRLHTNVYSVDGGLLAQLETQTGHSVWLMMGTEFPEPMDGVELAALAQALAAAPKQLDYRYDSVAVPKLEMDLEPNMDWLKGSYAVAADGTPWVIDQAFQMFKLRLNEHGARAKVATGIGVAMAAAFLPETLIFDQPFLGYFTQPGHDNLALAAFYAGLDSWQEPAGSLEDL